VPRLKLILDGQLWRVLGSFVAFIVNGRVQHAPSHLCNRTGPRQWCSLHLRESALLAGHKLLLADDSVTIQKVIDLTFADEGVQVITVGDGEQAIEKVEELLPDIVLADVFMPIFTGYQVCEYIKSSEKLKHIPVMLLVGSFEPFDEAEARRVGANDTLTKPFQSIRRLIEKVGDLVSSKPLASEIDTAELPGRESPEQETLSTAELEIVTADTMQMPDAMKRRAHEFVAKQEMASLNQNKMETQSSEMQAGTDNDGLLDLDDLEPAQAVADDDFELELDLDEAETRSQPAYSSAVEPSAAFASTLSGWEPQSSHVQTEAVPSPVIGQEVQVENTRYDSATTPAAVHPASAPISADNLSPEIIDAIARRAVEYLSEKVVREIAWEVVPQLAELMIKRRLEERESQPK